MMICPSVYMECEWEKVHISFKDSRERVIKSLDVCYINILASLGYGLMAECTTNIYKTWSSIPSTTLKKIPYCYLIMVVLRQTNNLHCCVTRLAICLTSIYWLQLSLEKQAPAKSDTMLFCEHC